MMFSVRVQGTGLDRLRRASHGMRRALMDGVRRAGLEVAGQAKVLVRQKLNTTGLSTGYLSRSITMLQFPQEMRVAVGPQAIYGRIHELGGVIVPRQAQYLRFRTARGWVTTKRVVMPARPYLQPALDSKRDDIERLLEGQVQALLEVD